MATFAQKDYQFLAVGKSGNVITQAGLITNLADGEIGVFTTGGVALTATTALTTDRFVIALGRGTSQPPLLSPFINKNDIKKGTRKVTVAATEQVDYIGYNGSANAIEVNNDTVYRASLNIKEPITQNHGGIYIKDLVYKSSSSATQAEIADGLIKNAIANFSREADPAIKFERVTSSTLTTSTSGNFTVTNGSKFVTAATDVDNGGVVVGDYLTFSGIAYKVVAINVGSAQVAELDIPYQGTSGTVTDANASFITAANAALGNWGIKMTGVAQSFVVGKKHYYKMRWTTSLDASSFGTTVITNSVSANEGAGVYEQIAELEWFVNGNNSEFFRMGEPNIFPLTSMVANEPYDLISIEFEDGRKDSLGYVNSPKVVTLAIPNATPDWATSLTNEITDVLEVLVFGATTGNPFNI